MARAGNRRNMIGFLWPEDGRNEDEYWRCLPKGFGLSTKRYPASCGLSVVELEGDADLDQISDSLGKWDPGEVDAVALGDSASSLILGREHERRILRMAARTTGRPVTAIGEAKVTALRTLGARRITLISPYLDEVTERFENYLIKRGFEVLSAACVQARDESVIASYRVEEWRRMTRRNLAPDAEAVVVAGGGIRISEGIDAMEVDFQLPVVAGPAALIWHACRLISADATHSGLGVLYSGHGNVELGT